MNRRHYWLWVTFSVLMSFSFLLWCWHDQTAADWKPEHSLMREQTKADHAASIGYALARVALTLALLELVPRPRSP